MKWTVIWKPTAENRLANLWTTSLDRAAVKAAADEIDQTLEKDPLTAGESRSKGRRILFVSPLVAYYEVREADRQVEVLLIDRARRR